MTTARVGVVAVAGLVFLSAGASAQARLGCSFSGPPRSLLTVTASGIDTHAEIRRSGDRIVIREPFGGTRTCSGGNPTVLNTDSIRVVVRRDALASLRLDGGALAPGATAETEGESEIEVEFLGRLAQHWVVGSPDADEFQWGPGGTYPGLNLNPRGGVDTDVDVTLRGRLSFMVAWGARGNDQINTAPNLGTAADKVFSDGGRGDDVLTGSILDGGLGDDHLMGTPWRDLLTSGRGDDRIAGGDGRDSINPGRGRDRVFGGPGRDRINAYDITGDFVSCGAGRDRVRADEQDRLRGCEVIAP